VQAKASLVQGDEVVLNPFALEIHSAVAAPAIEKLADLVEMLGFGVARKAPLRVIRGPEFLQEDPDSRVRDVWFSAWHESTEISVRPAAFGMGTAGFEPATSRV
jgi:hypothetical protein